MADSSNIRRGLTRHGFTLVELLVVVGIIAILIGVLLPSLARARQQAQQTQCASNLRQWGIGLQIYVDENKGLLPLKPADGTASAPIAPAPHGYPYPNQNVPNGLDDQTLYFNAIPLAMAKKGLYQMLLDDSRGINPMPAVGGNNLFTCPAAFAANLSSSGGNDTLFPADPQFYEFWGSDSSGQLISPAGSIAGFKANLSYVMSSNLIDEIAPTRTGQVIGFPTYMKMSRLRPASAVIVMVEKISNNSEYMDQSIKAASTQYPNTTGKNHFSGTTYIGYNNGIGQLKANWKRFSAIHKAGGNILFADGHVAWYKWTDVQLLKNDNGAHSLVYTDNTQSGINNAHGLDGRFDDANRQDLIWNPLGPCN